MHGEPAPSSGTADAGASTGTLEVNLGTEHTKQATARQLPQKATLGFHDAGDDAGDRARARRRVRGKVGEARGDPADDDGDQDEPPRGGSGAAAMDPPTGAVSWTADAGCWGFAGGSGTTCTT